MYRERKQVKRLLRAGADVNFAESNGQTALHHAARQGDLKLVRLLVSKQANMNARNVAGLVPNVLVINHFRRN